MAESTNQASDDWVLVGIVAGAVGVRGEVKVNLATDFPDRFKRLQTIYLGAEHRPITILGARRHGDRVALRLGDIEDRDAASALQGLELYIPQSQLMPLPEGRYYHDQIVGLKAFTTDGQALGTIVEVLTTGSNDVYVAREGTREVLIPAIRDVVRQIDLAEGRLVIEPVEGLL